MPSRSVLRQLQRTLRDCSGRRSAAYTLQQHHPELDAPGAAANLREEPGAVPGAGLGPVGGPPLRMGGLRSPLLAVRAMLVTR